MAAAPPDEIGNSLMVFHDRTTGRRKWGVFTLSDRTAMSTRDGDDEMRDGHWRVYWVYADEANPGKETGDVLELWRDPNFRMLNLGARTYPDDVDPEKQYHQFQIVCGEETVLIAPEKAMFDQWWSRLSAVRDRLQAEASIESTLSGASKSVLSQHRSGARSRAAVPSPFDFDFDEEDEWRGGGGGEPADDLNYAPPAQRRAPSALRDTMRCKLDDGRWLCGECSLAADDAGDWRLVWSVQNRQRELRIELDLSRFPDFQFFDDSVSDPASLLREQPDRPPMRPTFAFRVICGDDVAIFRADDRYQQQRWIARLAELANYLTAAGERDDTVAGRAEAQRDAELQQTALLARQRQRNRVVESTLARAPGSPAPSSKLLPTTDRGFNEVYEWLRAVEMEGYCQTLIDAGFDTLARFATIHQGDLITLGVKLGHARAIIDAVRGRSATTWRSTVATLISLVETREKALAADLSSVRVAASTLRACSKEVHDSVGVYYHNLNETLRAEEHAVMTRFDEIRDRKAKALDQQAHAIKSLKRTMVKTCKKAQEALDGSNGGAYGGAAAIHREVMTATPMIKRLKKLSMPKLAMPTESPGIKFIAPPAELRTRAKELLRTRIEGISPAHCTVEPVEREHTDDPSMDEGPSNLVRLVPRDHDGHVVELLPIVMDHVQISAVRVSSVPIEEERISGLRSSIHTAEMNKVKAKRGVETARRRLEDAQNELKRAQKVAERTNLVLAQLRSEEGKLAAETSAKAARDVTLLVPHTNDVVVHVHNGRDMQARSSAADDGGGDAEKTRALGALLASLDFAKYATVLKRNGFDSIDNLARAKLDDLVNECEMPRGHARQVMSCLEHEKQTTTETSSSKSARRGGKRRGKAGAKAMAEKAAADKHKMKSSEIHVFVRNHERGSSDAFALGRSTVSERSATTSSNGALMLEIALPRGVRWHTEKKMWEAQIFMNGRFCHLGFFNDRNDAIVVLHEKLQQQNGGAAIGEAAKSDWNGTYDMCVCLFFAQHFNGVPTISQFISSPSLSFPATAPSNCAVLRSRGALSVSSLHLTTSCVMSNLVTRMESSPGSGRSGAHRNFRTQCALSMQILRSKHHQFLKVTSSK